MTHADEGSEEGPLIEYDGEIHDLDLSPEAEDARLERSPDFASNDEWAFEQADRMIARLPQREGKDRRTEGEVFDHLTLMTIRRLMVGGVLKSLDFPVSTGKEANVFRGTTPLGGHVAVKIFRTNTSTFKHVLQYIQGDERFEGVTGDKRTLVNAWAQKEFRNLDRMRQAKVDVPEPIRVLNNVLVMEYLGLEEGPWPTLKELGRLDKKMAHKFWNKLKEDLIRVIRDAKLVHADLSEYNILVEDAGSKKPKVRIIDVGQAVLRTHPMAEEFLVRDLNNLTAYFRRQRIDSMPAEITSRIPEAA